MMQSNCESLKGKKRECIKFIFLLKPNEEEKQQNPTPMGSISSATQLQFFR